MQLSYEEVVMNKVSQRSLRDLHATLPAGTECYLCEAVRSALLKYRKGKEPQQSCPQEQAVSMLAGKLGRGLKRFLRKDVRSLLPQTTWQWSAERV
jgi:hypothetical protein